MAMQHTIIGAGFLAQQCIENMAELVKRNLLEEKVALDMAEVLGMSLFRATLEEARRELPQDVKFVLPQMKTCHCGETYVNGSPHACMGEV